MAEKAYLEMVKKADASRYKGKILLKEQPNFLGRASKPGEVGVIGLPEQVPFESVKMFDNVVWCGRQDVGILVIKTSEGLVLIDAMYPESAVEEYLYPALKKYGWDGEKILAVLITHGHYDHFVGCIPLVRDHGCKLYLSEEDTAILDHPDPRGKVHPYPKKIDEFLIDTKALTFGDTTFLPIIVRGHSPAGMSFVFPVYDNGVKHMAYVLGGGNALKDVSCGSRYIETVYRTNGILKAMGVDVCLSAHPKAMSLTEEMITAMNNRKPGDKNIMIVGEEEIAKVLYTKIIDTLQRLAEFADDMID